MRYTTPGESALFELLDKSRGGPQRATSTGIPFLDELVQTKEHRRYPAPGVNPLVDLALGRVKTKGRVNPRPGTLAALVAGAGGKKNKALSLNDFRSERAAAQLATDFEMTVSEILDSDQPTHVKVELLRKAANDLQILLAGKAEA